VPHTNFENAPYPKFGAYRRGRGAGGIILPHRHPEEQEGMTVARTTVISATSADSFEAAIKEGVVRATATVRNVERVRVESMNVLIRDNNIVGYKVDLAVTFVLESDTADERERGEFRGTYRSDAKYDSPAEFLRRHVLLKDFTEEEIQDSKRFLHVTPAKTGSGLTDVSLNHDRYLAED
jgi:flavin-binding protein dodecin